MWKPILISLLLCCSIGAKAQSNESAIPRIPFELTEYNNLLMKVVLNDVDTLDLMFHSAADAVHLTEAATRRLHLKFERVDQVKSWGGDVNASRFSPSNRIQLGDLQFENVPIWEDQNSGQHSDGKFGINLFDGKVIQIDFDRSVLLLPQQLPADIDSYVKHRLLSENGYLFIEATAVIGAQELSNKYLIHSGYAAAVLFDDVFVEAFGIADKLTIVDESELKDSFGNVLKTQRAILPQLTIGPIVLNQLPVSFFSGAVNRQKMSVIGGDFLKRFQIVIDSKREYIYLKPNSLTALPYLAI
ncbi:hypothetical protein [Flavobacterium sp. JP2137]|uniref:hypothetical protein n=1 Tax=Flavobacterium sp. JP2137 TaxID=3414510 RepID=UPI003D2FE942